MSYNIVEYISYNMGKRDLPDIYARGRGLIYIRQILSAHVITYTYFVCVKMAMLLDGVQ